MNKLMISTKFVKLATNARRFATVQKPSSTTATTTAKVEVIEEDVKDMSIHGLSLSDVKKAVKNVISSTDPKATAVKESPLGRWKLTDNFSKGYSYDHSA